MRISSILKAVSISVVALAIHTAAGPANEPKTIAITASRFTFEPSEITVKKGEPVTLVIKSMDVSHGLKIEELGVKTEVKKGQSVDVNFTPEELGTFEGKCAHFCGKGHGSMTLTVHVVE